MDLPREDEDGEMLLENEMIGGRFLGERGGNENGWGGLGHTDLLYPENASWEASSMVHTGWIVSLGTIHMRI